MGFYRSRLKHGSLLALIALALQLVLSFGHVHAGGPHVAPPVLGADTGGGQAAELPSPVDHDDHGASGDLCAICAVTAMAGSLLVPSPAGLPLPETVADIVTTSANATLLTDPRRSPFAPRGPPQA